MKLGDVCEKVGSGSTPRGGQSVYKLSGTPFIRSQNVLMNSFTSEGLVHITEATHTAMSNTTVQSEDVLLNITGASIGRVCVVPRDICPANVNQHVSIIRTTPALSSTYLSYFISSDDFQRYIMTNQAGGTRQALTKSQIEQFTVPLPPVLEQSRIASELDDKIAGVKLAEASIQQELDTIEAMPAALLRKAFSGGL
jgi:type I restriction enzyme S subunit